MRDKNIICFAKDWSEDPTSNNHVMRELSKRNRVLWLNSISTRAPDLSNARDIGKIFRKLGSFLKGPVEAEPNLWVYTPIVLPFHNSSWAVSLNRSILKLTLQMLRRRLKMREFQLWTFIPTAAEYVGALGESLVVYYVTDNFAHFRSLDSAKIEAMERQLAEKADIIFATSNPLAAKLRPFNPQTHLAQHGVKYDLFASALREDTPVPADIAALKHPVIGFYGLIEDWMDQKLIAYLAGRHPEWSIALIGKSCVDTSILDKFENIHLTGRKPHSELPGCCKGFAVGMIPHIVNDLTIHMNPIKLREYLSAGLQVVSTALPEVRQYDALCRVTESYEEFENQIVEALKQDSAAERRRRSELMREETWEKKVEELCLKIDAVT